MYSALEGNQFSVKHMRRYFLYSAVSLLAFIAGSIIAIKFYRSGSEQSLISIQQQTTPIERQESQAFVSRNGDLITRPDGWLIPDISKLKKSSPRSKWQPGQHSVDVYATSYESNKVLLPRVDLDGTIDPNRKVQVNSLTVFDIDKRPFCYRMLFWDVPLKGESGVGVVVYNTYYDLDGDGKFETFDIKGSVLMPLRMPQWTKR